MSAMRRRHASFVIVAASMIASCGGGGSNSGGTSPPTNKTPTFSSASSASVTENATGTIYAAVATDPEGLPVTYALSGGADRASFQLNSNGALTFVTSPDFEAPADADRNNVYQVEIAASDGVTSSVLALSVTVTNDPNDVYRIRRVTTGLAGAVFLAPVPDNSGRVFVVQRTGQIRILTPSTGAIATAPFLDVSRQISTDGERGLLGFTAAPDFATTGVFYVFLTNTAGTIEIRRYQTVAGNRDQADITTGDVIMSIPHLGASNHNGGWIGFGPDNYLYIAVGDGGSGTTPTGGQNAQSPRSLLGKILRIDVREDAFPGLVDADYTIPPNAPTEYARLGYLREVWALGLGNPYRASFDKENGNFYIGDVGQDRVEEVDLMRPDDVYSTNFGWDVREGTLPYTSYPDPQPITVPPVTEYSHGIESNQGSSIIGGYVYRGPVTTLKGLYFFADFVQPRVWTVPAAKLVRGETLPASQYTLLTLKPDAGTVDNISSFGVDQTGNLYIVGIDGEIFVIEPNP